MKSASCEASTAGEGSAVTILPPLTVPAHREADHRIANSLQLLCSLLLLQAREYGDSETAAALGAASQRVGAISAVHRQLYMSGSRRHVELSAYLDDLAQLWGESASLGSCRRPVSVEAEQVLVKAEQAIAVGVLVTELVINASKHAYAPNTPGRVIVRLARTGGCGFRLEVRDFGRGRVAGRSGPGSGLGSRVIAAMAGKLGGTYTYRDADPGTAFILDTHLGMRT